MQDVERITPTELAILRALGIFRFMTTDHLIRFGVTSSQRHLYSKLRNLLERRRAPIGALDFGAIPGIGRLARLFYLTEYGASLVEDAGDDPDAIKWPRKVRLFNHDYFHRLSCIDLHIALHRWARDTDTAIDCYDAYFDYGQMDGEGRARPRTSVAWDGGQLVPDAVFQITSPDGQTRLCAAELHKGTGIPGLMDKLGEYRKACEAWAIETAYGYKRRGRVLVVFENGKAMRRAAEKAQRDRVVGDRGGQFFFNTLENIGTAFAAGWLTLDGKTGPLFDLR